MLISFSSSLNIKIIIRLSVLYSLAPGKQEVSTLSPGHTLFPSYLGRGVV